MQEPLNDIGLSVPVLLAGFFGGVVRALSRGYTSFHEVLASPISGALCAGYLTKPVLHYANNMGIPLPPNDGITSDTGLLAAGFVVGICGMWITDFLLFKLGSFFKLSK